MIETIIQNATTSQLQSTCKQQSRTADVDQNLFTKPPESDGWYESEFREDEEWKLNKALYGYRKAPKMWHQHVSLLESKNYHPLLTDPSCFRNDKLNFNMFIHVDDGSLCGPKVKVLRLVELLSNQVMMRIVGRIEKLGDKNFLLGRVIERTARGYSVEAKSEVHPRRGRCARSGRLETRVDSICEEDTNDRVTGRAGEQEASRVQDSRGKAAVHDIMYSVKETARKTTCSTESDVMNVKRIARYLKKSVPSAKCLIEINRFPAFGNVYTDSDWAGQHQTCKSTSGGGTQWRSKTLSAWSRTQQSVSLIEFCLTQNYTP